MCLDGCDDAGEVKKSLEDTNPFAAILAPGFLKTSVKGLGRVGRSL